MNDVAIILLGGKRGGFALVDAADFPALNQFKWTKDELGYVMRTGWQGNGKRKSVRIHRQILDAPVRTDVDHENHCPIDNTRRNIRLASHLKNCRNRIKQGPPTSSRFKGVNWHKHRGKWVARITVEGVRKALGYFHEELQAALAYNLAAKNHFGAFANLNPI